MFQSGMKMCGGKSLFFFFNDDCTCHVFDIDKKGLNLYLANLLLL